ncbi:MAG: hypothetical protein QXP38_08145, partial [Nitrososphaerota archaeon]
ILIKFTRKKASRAHSNQKTMLSTLISNNFPKTYGLFGILLGMQGWYWTNSTYRIWGRPLTN